MDPYSIPPAHRSAAGTRTGGAVDLGGEGAGDAAAFVRIIRDAEQHQDRTQVRVAQAERAEIVRVFGDAVGGVARQIDQDLLRQEEHVDRVAVARDVEVALRVEELGQVQGRRTEIL